MVKFNSFAQIKKRLKTHLRIHKAKRAFYSAVQDQNLRADDLLSAKHLYHFLSKNTVSKTCHIIASGSTLFSSIKKIDIEHDKIIGFNFCGLSGLLCDLYLCEIANEYTRETALISDFQLRLAFASTKQNGLVVLKNLLEKNLDGKYIKRKYPAGTKVLKDIWAPIDPMSTDENDHRRLVEVLFQYDPVFIRQRITTALTAIGIASHSGFKNIVVHGLDFEGRHFYCHPSLEWPSYASCELKNMLVSSSASSKNSQQYYKAMPLIKHISAHLNQRKITLYAGSQLSLSAKHLPVYCPGFKE